MTKFNGSTLRVRGPPRAREKTVAERRLSFNPGRGGGSGYSFANPSGRRRGHELNTNSQFVQAYRLGTQGRDTNARCNQRPSNECSLSLNPRNRQPLSHRCENLDLLSKGWNPSKEEFNYFGGKQFSFLFPILYNEKRRRKSQVYN